jgi:hypothetical protein
MTTVLAQPDPPATDPDNVPETLCLGKFNVAVTGPLATFIFTHVRPKVVPLIDRGEMTFESVVRARIVVPTEHLVALRGVLDQIIKEKVTVATQGGSGKPN